jgi:hypothetical protein
MCVCCGEPGRVATPGSQGGPRADHGDHPFQSVMPCLIDNRSQSGPELSPGGHPKKRPRYELLRYAPPHSFGARVRTHLAALWERKIGWSIWTGLTRPATGMNNVWLKITKTLPEAIEIALQMHILGTVDRDLVPFPPQVFVQFGTRRQTGRQQCSMLSG